MRLRDLAPEFMRTSGQKTMCACSFEAAQGLLFLCPACFEKNGGEKGTHTLLIWFEGRDVPDAWRPPPRWQLVSGNSLDNLTVRPSIFVKTGCGWHGFITNGSIISVV